jgi:hypothetical protein
MKTYGRVDLSARWRCVINFKPRQLYLQRKSTRYPLDRRPGGPQSRSGRCGEERNPSPCRVSNPSPARSAVTTQNKLSRLASRGKYSLWVERNMSKCLNSLYAYTRTSWILKVYFLGGGRPSLPKYWKLLIQTVWHERLGVEAMWEIFSSDMTGEDSTYTHIH